jgi:pyruvate dehydrogenase E1 component alpha subunit
VGIAEDFDAGYRSRDEFETWKKRDPLALQRKKLIGLGVREDDITQLEKDIRNQVESSMKKAQDAPFPDGDELCREVV